MWVQNIYFYDQNFQLQTVPQYTSQSVNESDSARTYIRTMCELQYLVPLLHTKTVFFVFCFNFYQIHVHFHIVNISCGLQATESIYEWIYWNLNLTLAFQLTSST